MTRARTSGAILSIAALFLGFLQAPFVHIHPEDLDHPPASTLSHTHVHVAPPASGPALSAHTADDDAVDVEWSVTPAVHVAFSVHFTTSEPILIPAPALVSAALPIREPRGHDPPDLVPTQTRAPPA